MRECRSRAKSRDAGFSLFEMLVVLAIASLAALAAAPYIKHLSPEVEMRLEAGRLTAALRAARAHAISRGIDVPFELHPEHREWQIIGITSPRRVPEHVHVAVEAARALGPRGDSVGLVFFPDGSSTGGRIVLAHEAQRITIGVSWLDGTATVTGGGP